MKKIIPILIFICSIFQLISCSKKSDYIETIPSDADFVFQINLKSLAEKADLKDSENYIFTQNLLKKSSKEVQNIFKEIKENPSSIGLDLTTPIYIFGKKESNKIISTIIIKMNDKDDFEKQLQKIYDATFQQKIDFEEQNDFTFIKGNRKPFIAWNKNQFIFIASEYGVKTSTLETYFEKLIKPEKALVKNPLFIDFLKNGADINLWYTGKFVNYFIPAEKNKINLDQSHWINYLSFNDNNISFVQEFYPDPQAKIHFSKHPIWKKRINTDFYKYFPKESYFNLSFATYPQNINATIGHNNQYINQLKDYGIDIETIDKSSNGEFLFSVYDFEKYQKFNVSKDFGKKMELKKDVIIPQFILAGRMKNSDFIDQLKTTFGPNIKDLGNYYAVTFNPHQSIYFTYKNNLAYFTNNLKQIKNFTLNKVDKNNFLHSEFAGDAKNPMFINTNLNLEDYPIAVKENFLQSIPLGNNPLINDFANQFESFQFKIHNESKKTAVINLKKSNNNSLEIILKFIDQSYSLLTNPQSS